jgi:uncharacterized membrane protein
LFFSLDFFRIIDILANKGGKMPEVDKSIEEGKIFAFIGYWGLLFLVPILAKKDNKFALFHGKQGMVLTIAFIAVIILFSILSFIPYLGILFMIVEWLALIAMGVFAIIGMIKALTGAYWKMPILGDIAEKIKI